MKQSILIMLCMFLFYSPAQAVEIEAHVDRTHITINESLNLTVTIGSAKGSVDIFPIKDFRVVSKGTSSSIQIINSRVSKKISYNYMLIPLKEGRLAVPPLSVESDGKTYKTREITIFVSKEPQYDQDAGDVFVRAHISEQTPYEGRADTL